MRVKKLEFMPTEFIGDDFVLGLNYTKDQFSKAELKYLRKHGKRLSALEKKLAPAAFEDAKHFVDVFTNGAEPVTKRELLWKKYKAALVEEEEQKIIRVEEAKKSDRYKTRASRLSAP